MNDLFAHSDEIWRAFAIATPAARLREIKQRLAGTHGELGTTRLVALVAAVEALARSLVVHAVGRPASTAEMRHRQFRASGPLELVQEVLRLRNQPDGARKFGRGVWDDFEAATHWRDLVVHECTSIDPDLQPRLISAATSVLRGLIELAGLEAGLQAVA